MSFSLPTCKAASACLRQSLTAANSPRSRCTHAIATCAAGFGRRAAPAACGLPSPAASSAARLGDRAKPRRAPAARGNRHAHAHRPKLRRSPWPRQMWPPPRRSRRTRARSPRGPPAPGRASQDAARAGRTALLPAAPGPGRGVRRHFEVSVAAGKGEADNRGGKPSRNLLISGNVVEDAFRRAEMGDARAAGPVAGQRGRRRHQQGFRPDPSGVRRHAEETGGQGCAVALIDDLADGELIDDHRRRELPIGRLRRVPYGLVEKTVPGIPSRRASMKVRHDTRGTRT